jgi:hypothetical protein
VHFFQSRFTNGIDNKKFIEDIPTEDVKATVKIEKEDWQPVS